MDGGVTNALGWSFFDGYGLFDGFIVLGRSEAGSQPGTGRHLPPSLTFSKITGK